MAHKEALAGRLAKQARQIQARKGPQNQRAPRIRKVGPTPEWEERNQSQSAGMALRKVPTIDTLLRQDRITPNEHEALKVYGAKATEVHRSEVKSNLDREIRATGDMGAPPRLTAAKDELSRLDGILGQLRGICLAVCRDDTTIRQWCIDKYGTTQSGGKVRPVREVHHRKQALSDLRRAAKRLVKHGLAG